MDLGGALAELCGTPEFNTGLMALAAGGALWLAGLVVNASKALAAAKVQELVGSYPGLTCLYPLPFLLFFAMSLRLASLVVALCAATLFALIRLRGVRHISWRWIAFQILLYVVAFFGNRWWIDYRLRKDNDARQVLVVVPFEDLSTNDDRDQAAKLTLRLVEVLDEILDGVPEVDVLPPFRTENDAALDVWRLDDSRDAALTRLRLVPDVTLVNDFGSRDPMTLVTNVRISGRSGSPPGSARFTCSGSADDRHYLVLAIASEVAELALTLRDDLAAEAELEIKRRAIQHYCRLARVEPERESGFCDLFENDVMPPEAEQELRETTLEEFLDGLIGCGDVPRRENPRRQAGLAKLGAG